jgi:hypothetical protein
LRPHLAAREPKAGGEGGDGPLQAGAEALPGNIRGKLGLSGRAAVVAAPAQEPVPAHPNRDLRQLRDPVAAHRPPGRPIGRVPKRLGSACPSRVLIDVLKLVWQVEPKWLEELDRHALIEPQRHSRRVRRRLGLPDERSCERPGLLAC